MIRDKFTSIVIVVLFITTYVTAQTNNTAEYARVIVSAGQLDISKNPLCIVPTKGLYVAIVNTLISIDAKDNDSEITLNENVSIDNIVSTGSDLIIKQDTALLSFADDCKPIATFDTSSFNLFSSLDGNLFIASHGDSISNLMFYDTKQKKVKPLSQFDEKVIFVSGDTLQCYVVTETKIYLFKGEKGIKLIEYVEPIVTAISTDNGILFATKNKILLLRAANVVNVLAEFGCRRLISNKSSFYAEYDDGSIVWYNFKKKT